MPIKIVNTKAILSCKKRNKTWSKKVLSVDALPATDAEIKEQLAYESLNKIESAAMN